MEGEGHRGKEKREFIYTSVCVCVKERVNRLFVIKRLVYFLGTWTLQETHLACLSAVCHTNLETHTFDFTHNSRDRLYSAAIPCTISPVKTHTYISKGFPDEEHANWRPCFLFQVHKLSLSFCSVSPRSQLLLVPAGIHTFLMGLAHFHFGEEQIDVYGGWRSGRYDVGKAVYGVKCGYPLSTSRIQVLVQSQCYCQFLVGSTGELFKNRLLFHRL